MDLKLSGPRVQILSMEKDSHISTLMIFFIEKKTHEKKRRKEKVSTQGPLTLRKKIVFKEYSQM